MTARTTRRGPAPPVEELQEDLANASALIRTVSERADVQIDQTRALLIAARLVERVGRRLAGRDVGADAEAGDVPR
jgi:hypothetical protein